MHVMLVFACWSFMNLLDEWGFRHLRESTILMHGQPVKTAAMIPFQVRSILIGNCLKAACCNPPDSVLNSAMTSSFNQKANAMCTTWITFSPKFLWRSARLRSLISIADLLFLLQHRGGRWSNHRHTFLVIELPFARLLHGQSALPSKPCGSPSQYRSSCTY